MSDLPHNRENPSSPVVNCLDLFDKCASILANLFVVIGIFIALMQYCQTEKFNKEQVIKDQITEKKQYAVEALNDIYNQDFLNDLSSLLKIDSLENNTQIKAFNLVFNTYYKMAIIYNKEIGDTSIINNSIKTSLTDFKKCSVFIKANSSFEKSEIEKMYYQINKIHE